MLQRTREIQEFRTTTDHLVFAGYVNNLYLYPKKLDFSAFPGSHRNLAIEVKVLDNDDNPDQPGLKVSNSLLCNT